MEKLLITQMFDKYHQCTMKSISQWYGRSNTTPYLEEQGGYVHKESLTHRKEDKNILNPSL
jgi:hypothetical protein